MTQLCSFDLRQVYDHFAFNKNQDDPPLDGFLMEWSSQSQVRIKKRFKLVLVLLGAAAAVGMTGGQLGNGGFGGCNNEREGISAAVAEQE